MTLTVALVTKHWKRHDFMVIVHSSDSPLNVDCVKLHSVAKIFVIISFGMSAIASKAFSLLQGFSQ